MSDEQRQANLIATGAQALVARSRALGLIWTRRMATVVAPNDANTAIIVVDADSTTITAFSMVGIVVPGERVYVDIVPPGGHFIVGFAPTTGFNPPLPRPGVAVSLNQASSVGTTTSTTYVDVPGSPAVSLTKYLDSTRLLVQLNQTVIVTLSVNTQVRLGVNISTSLLDYDVCQISVGTLSQHDQASGVAMLTDVSAGDITVTARWRRAGGTGTLGTDGNDWISLLVQEVA